MKAMTPRQRMLAALRHEPLDRWCFATRNLHDFAWGPHAASAEYRAILQAVRRTGAGMLCGLPVVYGDPMPEYRKEQRRGPDGSIDSIEFMPTPEGDLRQVTRQTPGLPAMRVEPFIKDEADLRRFRSIRHEMTRWDLRLLPHADEVGEAGICNVGYFDPFYTVASLFDEQELIIRAHTEPGPILELIEETCQRFERDLKRLLEMMAKPRREVLFGCAGPELATPPLMSPSIFPVVITPFQRRLVKIIHEHGYLAYAHCHGRIRAALPEFIRCGFDAVEPCEPPPQGDITLAELMEQAGGKITIMGCVQDQDLQTRSADEIRAAVADIARTVGNSTGFIAMTTCTPFEFPPTPRFVENYIAYLEAAAEFTP
jgi:hypothetical protein